MNRLSATIALARRHGLWLALALMPLILAACNKGGGSAPGY
jgi:hypothetical protein